MNLVAPVIAPFRSAAPRACVREPAARDAITSVAERAQSARQLLSNSENCP